MLVELTLLSIRSEGKNSQCAITYAIESCASGMPESRALEFEVYALVWVSSDRCRTFERSHRTEFCGSRELRDWVHARAARDGVVSRARRAAASTALRGLMVGPIRNPRPVAELDVDDLTQRRSTSRPSATARIAATAADAHENRPDDNGSRSTSDGRDLLRNRGASTIPDGRLRPLTSSAARARWGTGFLRRGRSRDRHGGFGDRRL